MSIQSPLPIVQEHSDLSISFELSFPDGTLIEKSDADEPFRFQIGDGTFVPNLESLLIGLELGTSAKFTLSPDRAFGQHDPQNLHTMARSDFPEDMPLEEGHVIGFNTPTGDEIPARVHQLDGEEVVMDFNHPLAGQTVIFRVKIEAIHDSLQ
ncbi:FKBP-type peptidyl-prolyl cis-trans isomerase [Thiomicrorhabdus heinhorstiae]|uniref:Peptidyl-prolyl cis-trans isomerase n=1 Tax=Thiomicrorhabdus heinhorstiae TaxID=2748010 RepID=A0ABS0BXD1_9GAMM|nr:FKBP-type peptidyl-prolyl cis-trans isomerase [Thiomicrorhabdus heinhorstiae]MBF6058453.1 FKBP-type peptidyl-prolyl cis-trans isomerase [Thiomicrorhabdus heinhorstiae]